MRTEKPDFATPYLAFQPHDNAIMHMAFSSDDRHLATGSGDQSCRVVDMSTQTTIRTLAGSKSTVRYVSFQPGNDHVLATCSRDGSVSLYDIRCKCPIVAGKEKETANIKLQPRTTQHRFSISFRRISQTP